MNSDQRIMDFSVETGLYVNIPLVIILYLNKIRSEISTTALQLYIYYHFLWRNNDYQTSLSINALASALNSTPSTINRANSQLVNAGLITRHGRSLPTGQGTKMRISSTTRPAIPDALLEEIHKMPVRQPFIHHEAGEIWSLSEFLEKIEQDGTATESDPIQFFYDIIDRLSNLVETGAVDATQEKLESLAREVTWSVFEGQFSRSEGFQSISHKRNVALKKIRLNEWKSPRGYRKDYLAGVSTPNRKGKGTPTDEVQF